MIVPWGHESARLRNTPWVTYGIIAACAVAFLATHGLGDPVLDEAQARLGEAYDYWADHPYLDPPERIVEVYGDPGAEARAAFRAEWEAEGLPPAASDTLREEQAEFDARVAEADALLRDHVWFRYGLVPAAPEARALFAHLFLHEGWLHLLGNMLFLFLAGPLLEDRFGRGLFALFYAAAGLAAAALFVARSPGFDGPLIGASGAVAGALGAFLVCFGRARIRFAYWLGFFFGTFAAPAWLVLPLWFAHELASASLAGAGAAAGGVAYWAHVGGFVFGAAAAVAVRAAEPGGETDAAAEPPAQAGERTALAAARRALRDGHAGDAVALLAPDIEGGAADPPRIGLWVEACAATGRDDEGRAVLARALEAAVRDGRREAALALWRAAPAASGVPLDAESLLRLAGWLRAAARPGEAVAALWSALAAGDPVAAPRIARAARGLDPVVALRAARAALAAEPRDEERLALEALATEAAREAEARGVIVVPDPAPADAVRGGTAAPPAAAGAPEARSAAVAPQLEPSAFDPHALELDEEQGGEPDYDALAAALADDGLDAPAPQTSAGPAPDPDAPLARDTARPLAPAPQTSAGPAPDPDAPLARDTARPLAPAPQTSAGPAPDPGAPLARDAARPLAPPRALRVLPALPLALDDDVLWLDVAGKGRTRLALSRVDGLAAAGVRGLASAARGGAGPRAVLVVDLTLNLRDAPDAPLRVVRLRSDGFDPLRLVPGGTSPLVALRRFLSALLERTGASALTRGAGDPETAFPAFPDLETYEREVLGARS